MNNRKICLYGRVSTDQQTSGLESQVRALKNFCTFSNITEYELFLDENQSGAKQSRPALDRLLTAVRNNEVEKIIVYSLSRLGRSTTHLLKCMEELNKFNVKFVSLSEKLETETAAGRMIFTVLAAVSQLERELIVERVKVGLANARAKGKLIGRKKLRDSDLIRKLLKAGMTYRNIAIIAKCSHGSVHQEYRVKKLAESEATRYETRIEERRRLKAEKVLVNQKVPAEVS